MNYLFHESRRFLMAVCVISIVGSLLNGGGNTLQVILFWVFARVFVGVVAKKREDKRDKVAQNWRDIENLASAKTDAEVERLERMKKLREIKNQRW